MHKKAVYIITILIGLYVVTASAIKTYQLINAAKTIPNFGVDATEPLFIMLPGLFGLVAILGGIAGIREVKSGKIVSIVGILFALLFIVLF